MFISVRLILMMALLMVVAPMDITGADASQSTSPTAAPAGLKVKRYDFVLGKYVERDVVDPSLRTMRYTSRSTTEALAWQKELRSKLARLMKVDDLLNTGSTISFDAKVMDTRQVNNFEVREIEINSTRGRRIRLLVTLPNQRMGLIPAVVCIGGHGSSLYTTYDDSVHKRPPEVMKSDVIYRAFGSELASRGYITIANSISWHEVREPGRTLMGERLWDQIRCVDFLRSMPEVDGAKIGCAGLSLGGEMAMWLGAMDLRVAAVVSSGFLTSMDQIDRYACQCQDYGTSPVQRPCWNFAGLRELVDFPEIYSLIAPRPLQCQNGYLEADTYFCVPLARQMMEQLRLIYVDMERSEDVTLVAHRGYDPTCLGHVIDLPSLLCFFEKYLPLPPSGQAGAH